MSAVLAVDPGRDKCGVALVAPTGDILFQKIVPTKELDAAVDALIRKHAPRVIMGDGTTSGAAYARIERIAGPGAVTLVDEYRTTDEARRVYWEAHPPRGWRRLVPRGMLVPPVPVDDFAAVVLARRFLAGCRSSLAAEKPPD